jgi:transcriptional antiterminator NusG
MVMTDESWHAVRNITGVTGFVGPGSRPTPLSEQEVADMSIESADEAKVQLTFKVGDEVSIVGGLFEGYEGVVQNISEDLKTVTVLVKRGRRDMPVEIEAEVLKLKTQI